MMTSRLFRVDMSESSRDFAAVATEPGLAMLDAQQVNYSILSRWLGRLVAEPQLHGERMVSFYVRDEDRGRLENILCQPATKRDLQGSLKADFEALETGIRKAKPESATETALHRIITKTFKQHTADLDSSDFHHYFFKYRAGHEPWRLVWCWGYQRKDLEPAGTQICTKEECHQLFVHKPKTKKRCPACSTVPVKKRRGPAIVLSPTVLLLLLLLGLGLLYYFGQPRLVVTPESWNGPRGSRVPFEVVDHRWFFFKDDITAKAVPLSHDNQVMQFRHGTEGRAKGEGGTVVTFHFGDRHTDVTVQVGPPRPPDSLSIEPGELEFAVDATQRVKVIGNYADGDPLDLTSDATLETADQQIAYASGDRLHGVAPGKTTLTAAYQAGEDGPTKTAEADVNISVAAYAKLQVALDPEELSVGQTGELKVTGVTADGAEFDLIGSKKLDLTIEPAGCVTRDDAYLMGAKAGDARIIATLGDLTATLDFQVGDSALAVFDVQPREVKLPVGSFRDLDVAGTGEEISTESSNDEIVTVESLGPFSYRLSAAKPGAATVTFGQGAQQQTVEVTVVENNLESVRVEPSVLALHVAEEAEISVLGVRADGTTVPISPDQLEILQQPRSEYVDFDRVSMTVFGLRPTPTDDKMIFKYGDLPPVEMPISVAQRFATDVVDIWEPYPPIGVTQVGPVVTGPVAIGGGSLIGDGLVYQGGRGLVVGDVIPPGLVGTQVRPGSVIGAIGGRDITNIRDPNLLDQYINNLALGDTIGIVGPDGGLIDIVVGKIRGFEQVQLNYAKETDVSAENFSAELNLQFRKAGQYRVTDAAGNELSGWQAYGTGAAATIVTAPITRTPGQNEYEIYVERDINGKIDKFLFSLALEAGGGPIE